MNCQIEPVKIINANGKALFGMYHIPEKNMLPYGIIILSPGIKSRVGNHRLYIKMAERFLEQGFPILRVDPEGLGDSEGEIEYQYTADVYGSIQVGRYIKDTISAMNDFESKLNVSKFILTGLCGGAITGLLAGVQDKRVVAILSLGIPVILDGSSVDHKKYITDGQKKSIRDKYIKKIFNFDAWKRFLSFKSDYKLILSTIVKPIKLKMFNKKQTTSEKNDKNPSQVAVNTNLNPHFPDAFIEFIKTRKILLLFSEADRLYWEFDEKFYQYNQQLLEKYKNNFSIDIIKEANHVLTFKEWQTEFYDKSCEWLKQVVN